MIRQINEQEGDKSNKNTHFTASAYVCADKLKSRMNRPAELLRAYFELKTELKTELGTEEKQQKFHAVHHQASKPDLTSLTPLTLSTTTWEARK